MTHRLEQRQQPCSHVTKKLIKRYAPTGVEITIWKLPTQCCIINYMLSLLMLLSVTMMSWRELKSTFGVGAVSLVICNYIVLFFFFTKFSITKLLIKSNTSAQPQVQPSATEGALALKALKAAPLPALHECCVTSDGIVQAQLNL